MSGPVIETDHRVRPGGNFHQLCVTHELQVRTGRRPDHSSSLVDELKHLQYGLDGSNRSESDVDVLSRKLRIDGVGEITGNAGDHFGELDGLGDVMDEIDENGKVHEEKSLRH